ncbi:amino acid transporter [Croceicoccus estronivorus]|uniref:peptide MFS transporter n=1 Tax=Croceicoccus estronivorus TaxID=1172626 RepID=UPI00082BADB0|nr:peptide MFS transporter [Croceicoccus estronivorus]OCC22421.1 amino acid transporter [Croceicoccus estronivorus]
MTAGAPETERTDRFGHPRGLWVLSGTELWDRISFHGMQAMLVLYMAGELLKPGRIEHVVGFDRYRATVEWVTGPLSAQALATQTFGLYVAFLTFFPLIGGWIGDRWTSRRTAVTLGALLMTAGHFSLAFDESFLLALLFLILGAGLLRGNLKAQIKTLYAEGDRRLADAFQVYSFVVNFGAFIAPIATGTVAKYYGWHAGFALAGVGMLIGLVVYLIGSRHLPADRAKRQAVVRSKLTSRERQNVMGLVMMWPVSLCFWTAQAQIWNVYNLWVRDHVDLTVGNFEVPVPWMQSLDGLAPALFIPLVVWHWRRQARRGTEPDIFTKIGIGCVIFAGAVVWLAAAPLAANADGLAPLLWPVMFHLISNFGAVYFSPVMLALWASRAPASWRGTLLGVETLSASAASLISGYMGGWYEKMAPSHFWLINAMIVGGAGLAVLALRKPLTRYFGPEEAMPEPDGQT